jgi:hypothetical protein
LLLTYDIISMETCFEVKERERKRNVGKWVGERKRRIVKELERGETERERERERELWKVPCRAVIHR